MTKSDPFKVVLLGESKIGKTSFISLAVKNELPKNIEPTVTPLIIPKEFNFSDKTVHFDIWDIPGQAQYRELMKVFFSDAKAILLMYDCTNKASFDEIKNYWYGATKEKNIDPIYFLIENKNDLISEKKVDDKEGKEFADSIGASFASISCKNNTGIKEIFEKLAEKLLK